MKKFSMMNFWESSIIMSWFNILASFLRMLILLPLILIYFDDVEIASWLLFSSIIYFSDILNEQASLIISRMIAAAYGGANDFRVILADRKPKNIGRVNWELIYRLYGSLGPINLFLATIGLIIASIFGLLSFYPLLDDYSNPQIIWNSLFVFLTGQFFLHLFRRFASLLRGCNKVALNSRWEALFSVLSTIIGTLVLLLGGNILQLSISMQIILLFRVLCQYRLVLGVVPIPSNLIAWNLDKKIIPILFTPLWRSIVRAFTINGAYKVGIILLARNAEVAFLTKFLLSIKLFELVDQFSCVPITSKVPRLTRLLASNKLLALGKEVIVAFKRFFYLEVFGVILLIYFGSQLLSLVNDNKELLAMNDLLLLSGGFLLNSFIKYSFTLTLLGNNIIAVKRLLVSVVLSCVILAWIIPNQPFWGFVLGAYLPMILILNIYPIKEGCALINMPVKYFIFKTIFGPLFLFILTISGLAFL
jgi:hypothetical protein